MVRLRQDELEAIGELLIVSEARLTAVVLKCNADDYQLVKVPARKDPDGTLEQRPITILLRSS